MIPVYHAAFDNGQLVTMSIVSASLGKEGAGGVMLSPWHA
jgi:hypothetical protein